MHIPSHNDSQAYHWSLGAQHSGQEMQLLREDLERLDCKAGEFTRGCTLESPGSHPQVLVMVRGVAGYQEF